MGQDARAGARWALIFGLAFGPVVGLITGLAGGLARRGWRIGPVERSWWLIVGLVVGLGFGLGVGLFVGLDQGLALGLRWGLASGLASGLVAGLVVGFFVRSSKHPAPGARIEAFARSSLVVATAFGLGMGLFAALVVGIGDALIRAAAFGPVVALSDRLVSVLGFRLVHHLAMSLGDRLTFGLVIGLCGGLVVWLANGGAAYLRQRALMWLLVQDGLLPANLLGLLEYAVSRRLLYRAHGGYQFVHPLLEERIAEWWRERPSHQWSSVVPLRRRSGHANS
jgi:hypothetical protein